MFLGTAFRLSFFVTLGLACACLALAESFFLGWMGYFLAASLALLAFAYRWESRWALSADAANRLGMVIAIGSAFWILFKLPRNEDDLLASGVPWPAGLLPHLGPLLFLLLLVKLFRPKRLADFWVMQTIGLMMVTLSCVLAAEPLFGVLLVLYLASLLWSLSLFYLVREGAWCRSNENPGPGLRSDASLFSLFSAAEGEPTLALPWRHLGLARGAGWTCLVVVLGLALFLVAPRQDNFQWEPKQLTSAAKNVMRTGSGEAGMDLNRVGKIELSEEPAFEVQAIDVRGPKLDLDPDTRWYMQTLEYYAQGRWTNWNQGAAPANWIWGLSPNKDFLGIPLVEGISHPRSPPSNLADPDFYLYFKVRLATAGGLVLAEPLVGTRMGLYPHLGEKPVEAASFFAHQIGTDSLLTSTNRWRQLYQYGQVLRKPATSDLIAAKAVNDRYRQFITNLQEVPEAISRWVRELRDKLPGVSAEEFPSDPKSPVPIAAQTKVALALTRYLAFSGEFGYSLDLQRSRRDMDPLADFLLNVQEGHCERYAGGLTLMLRSLGIPARVVRGYRGLEHLGEGTYVIRQSQAHSWVEALVEDDAKTNFWLTLDPTPSTERTVKPILSWFGLLFQRWTDGDNMWHSYIMEYNADQQEKTFDLLQGQLIPDSPWVPAGILLGFGLIGMGVFWGYKIRRRRQLMLGSPETAWKENLGHHGFYSRFLDVVQNCLDRKPAPGETPLEFGRSIQSCLVVDSAAEIDDAAVIPMRLTELLYRSRFGGHILTAGEEQEANRQLEHLAAFLRK